MTDRNYYLHDGVGRSGDVVIRTIVEKVRALRTENREVDVIRIGRDSYRTMIGNLEDCGTIPVTKWPPSEQNVEFYNTRVEVMDENFGIEVVPVPREGDDA